MLNSRSCKPLGIRGRKWQTWVSVKTSPKNWGRLIPQKPVYVYKIIQIQLPKKNYNHSQVQSKWYCKNNNHKNDNLHPEKSCMNNCILALYVARMWIHIPPPPFVVQRPDTGRLRWRLGQDRRDVLELALKLRSMGNFGGLYMVCTLWFMDGLYTYNIYIYT